MITNKTFSYKSTGERVISYWQGDQLYANIIRRSTRKIYDVVFTDCSKKGVYGCKSKSEAENELF